MNTGWIPVLGGPEDGSDFYPPDDPEPKALVMLREDYATGCYRYSEDGRAVVWHPKGSS